MLVFAVFSLHLPTVKADILDGTVETSLDYGQTVSTSEQLYLDPGETLHINVNNGGPGMVYFKVYAPSTNQIVTSGYLSDRESVSYPKGAPVGNYRIQLKCTTGSSVFTNCHAAAFLSDD